MEAMQVLIAINTFCVLGVGGLVVRYVVATERRLTKLETKVEVMGRAHK